MAGRLLTGSGAGERGSHLDDERLSALVDDEASAGEEAHAATCPDCAARAAAWRSARDALALAPDPPSAAERAAAVTAALTLADGMGPAVGPPGPPGPPVRLAGRRPPPGRRVRIAAGVAVLAAISGVSLAVTRGGGSSHTTSGTSVSAPAGPAAAHSASVSAGPAGTGSAGTGGAQAVVTLPGDQGPATLVAALRAALRVTPATEDIRPAPPAWRRCLAVAATHAALPPDSTPALQVSLTYRGAPAQAYVFGSARAHIAEVVATPGCSWLAGVRF
jgi:anti-sigma factor RsiW